MFKRHFFSLLLATVSSQIQIFCMELAIQDSARDQNLVSVEEKAKDKTDSRPFLFRLFDLPLEFAAFPKDIQREIVKKLPIPFKPVRPRPTQLIHNQLESRDAIFVMSKDGALFALLERMAWTENGFAIKIWIDFLRNPNPETELIQIDWPSCGCMAFNNAGTQLLFDAGNALELVTLVQAKVVNRRRIPIASSIFLSKIGGLPDGTFLLVCRDLAVLSLDPATAILTVLNNPDPIKKCTSFTFSNHEERPAIICSEQHERLYVEFDVKTKTWLQLPEIVQDYGSGDQKAFYNADKSLLFVGGICKTKLWSVGAGIPRLLRSFRAGVEDVRSDSLYVLLDDRKFRSTFLCCLKTGACIVGIPDSMSGAHQLFTPQGDAIITFGGKCGLYLYEWNPQWDEYALFYAKPLLLAQYLFIKYLHCLGSCGLTLNSEGACALERHKKHFTQIDIPLTVQDLQELKEVFLSCDASVQKYLRHKYHFSF